MKTELHNHMESAYDAVKDIKKMFDRWEELGYEAVAVTDHGSLNAIPDVWDENAKRGNKLNIIYGCELYVAVPELYDMDDTTAHMIVMAKNSLGKTGLDKLMRLANENINKKDQPIVTFEMLEKLFGVNGKYKDSCIFTTACIQGVPSLHLLKNERTQTQANKLKAKIETGLSEKKMTDPDSGVYKETLDELKSTEARTKKLSEDVKSQKALSKKTFASLLKRADTAEKNGYDEKAKALRDEANEIKASAEKAMANLKVLEPALKLEQKKLSSLKEDAKKLEASVEKFKKADAQLKKLVSGQIPEEKLYENALGATRRLSEMLGKDNLFCEIQYHGLSKEKYCYGEMIKIARELGLRLVAANDSHMVDDSPEEFTRRQVAKYLRYASLFDETEEEEAAEHEYYTKDQDVLRQWLLKVYPEDAVDEAIRNANIIGDICSVKEPTEPHYPVFDKDKDSKALLRKMAYDGIKVRFGENEEGFTDEYRARLERELDVICSMGFADYHLIVADFIKYGLVIGCLPQELVSQAPLSIEEAKAFCSERGYDVGLGIGPGRGSAAGSLVCYLIEITNVDPIKYNLKFERFLNPERYSMPDIDVDLSPYVRERVVDYVTNKYGKGAICRILTKGYEKCKGAIRDASRYYAAVNGLDPKEVLKLDTEIRKAVPNDPNVSFSDEVNDAETLYEFLRGVYASNKMALEILYIAKCIEGAFFSYGIHAAGVVISDNDDVTDYIPLRYNTKNECWTTCCTKEQVEHEGLLKMDFLGLRNLNIITDALMLIKKNHGINLDAMNLPIEREVIENIFAKGNTVGVFQFESAGMRKFLRQMHPTQIEDLFIANAMFRPGPMQFIDMVCDIKNGRKEPEYLCEELKPILGVTYSAIVYQEQVMQICQDLAGYTMGQADMVRKYMSKKKAEPLKAERKSFVYGDAERNIKGCVANGIKEKVANKIFDQMMDFASYAFNKSHAAAYSLVAYATGYLKYHYPVEYMCSLLNWTSDVSKYLPVIADARAMGVEVLPPDVNHSASNFSVRNGKILFGLGSIKGVGAGADMIAEKRKEASFRDIKDFILRSGTTQKVTESLAKCGAFDNMNYTRASLNEYVLDALFGFAKNIKDATKKCEDLTKGLEVIKAHEDITEVAAMQKKFDEAGVSIKLTAKSVPTADSYIKRIQTQKDAIENATAELKAFNIKRIDENKAKNLENERAGMGIYLTGHPTDGVTLREGQNLIKDITEEDTVVTGVITEVTVRYNRLKKPFYTFIIEDATGFMSGVFFDGNSPKAALIKEGSVLTLAGSIEKDDYKSTDEDIIYQINAKTAEKATVNEKKVYVLNVPNAAHYRGAKEKLHSIKKENGADAYIYFMDSCKFAHLTFTVDEKSFIDLGATEFKA